MSKRLRSNATPLSCSHCMMGFQMCRGGVTGKFRQAMSPNHLQLYKKQQCFPLLPNQVCSSKHQTATTKKAYPEPKNLSPKRLFSCDCNKIPKERAFVTNHSSENSLATKRRKLKENPCSISTLGPT